MDALCDAIEARWAGASGATVRGLANGLFFGMEPGRIEEPFVRYHLISNAAEYDFGPKEENDAVIQFSVFSRGADRSEAASVGEALMALYDFAALTVAGWQFATMHRDDATLEGTENNWHYIIRYRAILHKN